MLDYKFFTSTYHWRGINMWNWDWWIHTTWEGNPWRFCLCWNTKRAWITSSRTVSTRVAQESIEQAWIPSVEVYSGVMDSWEQTNLFHICCWCLWHEIPKEEHAQHLVDILKEYYEISEDWKGKKYTGLIFDWDYEKWEVDVSMLGYVERCWKGSGVSSPRNIKTNPTSIFPPIMVQNTNLSYQKMNHPYWIRRTSSSCSRLQDLSCFTHEGLM